MATRTDRVKTIFEAEDKNFTSTQKKVSGGFKNIDDGSKKMQGGLGSLVGTLGGVAAALGVVAGAAATVDFLGSTIKAASDAEEIQNKFNVVFESIQSDAEATAQSLAENYGLSQNASRDLLSGTGDLLTGFGLTDQAALDLSTQVQELSVDLASFNNLQGGSKQASDILTKALLGERDALTTLGVKISEADLQTRLAAEGKDELTGNALLAAKAEATFALVLEQTEKAQGDFARSSDSVANKQRVLQARMEDMKAEIGERLLPVWNQFLTGLLEVLPVITEVISKGFDWIMETIDTFSTFVEENWGIIKPLLIGFGVAVTAVLIPAFVAWAISAGAAAIATIAATLPLIAVIAAITLVVGAILWLIQNFNAVKATVLNVFSTVKDFIVNNIGTIIGILFGPLGIAIKWVIDNFENIKNTVVNVFNTVKETIGNVITNIKDSINNFFSGVASIGSNIANVFKELINKVINRINNALEFTIDVGITSVDVDLPDLPQLATGTTYFPGGMALVGEQGPELVRMPRGAEVITNDRTDRALDGQGSTINNYNYFQEEVDMNRVSKKLAFDINL